MNRAIELAAKAGLGERSGGCFGAVIVQDGLIVGEGYNQVLSHHDPTCRAEIQAIRHASNYLGTHILSDCTLFSSCMPCPMSLIACKYAQIHNIVYASTASDAKEYGGFDDNPYDIIGKSVHDKDGQTRMITLWKAYKDSKPVLYT